MPVVRVLKTPAARRFMKAFPLTNHRLESPVLATFLAYYRPFTLLNGPPVILPLESCIF